MILSASLRRTQRKRSVCERARVRRDEVPRRRRPEGDRPKRSEAKRREASEEGGGWQPVEELFESFNGLPLLSGVFQKDPLQWAKPTGASPKTRGSVEERGSSTGCWGAHSPEVGAADQQHRSVEGDPPNRAHHAAVFRRGGDWSSMLPHARCSSVAPHMVRPITRATRGSAACTMCGAMGDRTRSFARSRFGGSPPADRSVTTTETSRASDHARARDHGHEARA